MRTRAETRTRLAGLAAALLAAVAVYANSLQNGFVWDDHDLIVRNRTVKSLRYLPDVLGNDFFQDHADDGEYGYYRPLTTLSYLVDYQVWRLRPIGYHLTNVGLHALATLAGVLLLWRLGLGLREGLLAGLLFAVHPIHTENVAWIAGRTDLLALLFSVAALLLHLASPRPATRALAAAAYALGLLAKEMSVVVLPWLWLVEARREPGTRRILRDLLPYVAVTLAYGAWRFLAIQVGTPGTTDEHALGRVLLGALPLIARYLGWMAAPADLNAYAVNPYVVSLADPRLLASVATLGALGALVYRSRQRMPQVPLLAGMLAVSFLPILNVVRVAAPPDMGNVMAERFCYFPSLPFLGLVALGMAAAWDRWASRNRAAQAVLGAGLAAAVAAAALLTVRRNRDWRDEETLFTRTLAQNPNAVLLLNNLATRLIQDGDLDAAERHIARAVELAPQNTAVLSRRVHWLSVQGRRAEAIPIQEAIVAAAERGRPLALNNLAFLQRAEGRRDAARAILEDLVRRDRAPTEAYYNLARIEAEDGRYDAARLHLRRACADWPDDFRVASELAFLEAQGGHHDAAEGIYREQIARHPQEPDLPNDWAATRARRGDTAGAIEILERLLREHPGYSRGRINLVRILAASGRRDEAARQLREAERLAPGAVVAAAAEARAAEAEEGRITRGLKP